MSAYDFQLYIEYPAEETPLSISIYCDPTDSVYMITVSDLPSTGLAHFSDFSMHYDVTSQEGHIEGLAQYVAFLSRIKYYMGEGELSLKEMSEFMIFHISYSGTAFIGESTGCC